MLRNRGSRRKNNWRYLIGWRTCYDPGSSLLHQTYNVCSTYEAFFTSACIWHTAQHFLRKRVIFKAENRSDQHILSYPCCWLECSLLNRVLLCVVFCNDDLLRWVHIITGIITACQVSFSPQNKITSKVVWDVNILISCVFISILGVTHSKSVWDSKWFLMKMLIGSLYSILCCTVMHGKPFSCCHSLKYHKKHDRLFKKWFPDFSC